MSHNHFIQNKSKKPSRKTTGRAAVMIAAMLVTLLFCSVTAFAWFSANVANTGNTIETGNYSLNIVIKDSSGDEVVASHSADSSYVLAADEKYTVQLTADGSVTKGYCKITTDGKTYYTNQIEKENPLTFTIQSDVEATWVFTPTWGTYSGDDTIDPDQGIVVGTPSAGNSLNNEPSKPESTVSEAPESKDEAVEETPSEPVESKVESTESQTSSTESTESQTSSTESTESQVSETSGTSATSEDPNTESPDEGTETETETETETTTSVEE